MARAILIVAGLVWLVAGITGVVVTRVGTGWLVQVLPPLDVGADAVGGATATFSIGLIVVGAAHAVAAAFLRAGPRWGRAAALLLTLTLAAAFVSLAVAAFTTAYAQPGATAGFGAAGVAALALAVVYSSAAYGIFGRMRSEGRL